MKEQLKQGFLEKWGKNFPGADLPLTFFYSEDPGNAQPAILTEGGVHRCMVADLIRVRQGQAVYFEKATAVCSGARRYLGFSQELMPNFEFFLSCGIPGRLEGERYKKSPEIVKHLIEAAPKFEAPKPYIVFKRWDILEAGDEPAVVIFFAPPDVLSGLFTLAGFDTAEPQAVIAPFSAGCGSIVQHPYLELQRPEPRAVLGMFDVSARPFVPAGILSFSIPMPKFEKMVADMDESFLITDSWRKVKTRIAKCNTP